MVVKKNMVFYCIFFGFFFVKETWYFYCRTRAKNKGIICLKTKKNKETSGMPITVRTCSFAHPCDPSG